jgi:hypothetical protein
MVQAQYKSTQNVQTTPFVKSPWYLPAARKKSTRSQRQWKPTKKGFVAAIVQDCA